MRKVFLFLLTGALLTSCVKKSDHDELQADYDALEMSNLTLEGRVSELQGQVSTLSTNNANLIASNSSLSSDLSDVKNNLAETVALLADSNAEVGVLTTQISGLETQVAALQYAVDKENVAKIQAKINLLEKNLEDAVDIRDDQQAKVDVASNTLTAALDKYEDLNVEINVLQAQIEADPETETNGNLADKILAANKYYLDTVQPAQANYDAALDILAPLQVIVDNITLEIVNWEDRLEELLDELTL